MNPGVCPGLSPAGLVQAASCLEWVPSSYSPCLNTPRSQGLAQMPALLGPSLMPGWPCPFLNLHSAGPEFMLWLTGGDARMELICALLGCHAFPGGRDP